MNGSNGFVQVPNEILFDAKLSEGARLLYAQLMHLSWSLGGEIALTQAQISMEVGVSAKTVWSRLQELEKSGLVEVDRAKGSSSVYRFPKRTSVNFTDPSVNSSEQRPQKLPSPPSSRRHEDLGALAREPLKAKHVCSAGCRSVSFTYADDLQAHLEIEHGHPRSAAA